MTGVIYHELFGKHLEGYQHVESPGRYAAVMERLRNCGVTEHLSFVEAQPARPEWIEAVHDHDFVNGILSMEVDSSVVLDWGDTVATKFTQQAAILSAGAGVQAAEKVLNGELDSVFCAVRPPGHHAERDRAMGFCIFNNIAIAAAWLLGEGGLGRVAIVDWDIHHGNGTERIFIEDDRLLYISLHQYPHYPGTGHENTTGIGKGDGFTLNIPVGVGSGDAMYLNKFDNVVVPALDKFEPEFILISAGFDGHSDDPLSGGLLTSGVFGEMTRRLMDVADRHCGGKIVSLMEGGYNLDALADSIEVHVTTLAVGGSINTDSGRKE
ncbi:MAG: histone deacetylase [Candidatus Krumholzibacteria bacterium]|nr:histone deacetylase [Candidatus Krumholzibacteria bacterium]